MAKHRREVERLEDELADVAKDREVRVASRAALSPAADALQMARAKNQGAMSEMLEKRLSDAHEAAQNKLRRSLQAAEVNWKAKLKAAMEDQFEVEKRLVRRLPRTARGGR